MWKVHVEIEKKSLFFNHVQLEGAFAHRREETKTLIPAPNEKAG